MAESHLLLDCNYLLHRAFHALGNLAYDGEGTGATFGFLRDLEDMPALLGTTRVAFAFDGGHDFRTAALPGYKATRHNKPRTEEETEARQNLERQIRLLRKEYLPACGYRNVWFQRGVEADDLLAAAAKALPEGVEAFIVSADNDVWQCINAAVSVYNPSSGKVLTAEKFYKLWGLPAGMWPHVKAIAGDVTDDIPGVRGIGPKLAAGYYTGKVKVGSKAHAKIVGEGILVHNKNLKLVRLPCPGTITPVWRSDCVTREKIEIVYDCLGFKSLLGGGGPRGVRQAVGFGL